MKRIKHKYGKVYFILVYIIIVAVAVFIFNEYINRQMKQQLMSSLYDVSNQTLVAIQNKINRKLTELEELAKELSSDNNLDYKAKEDYLRGYANVLGYEALAIALPDGTVYTDNKSYNISEREYFQRSMNGEQCISETVSDLRNGNNINPYSVPIFDNNGNINGVLFGVDPTENFMKMFQVPMFNGEGYTYLINSEGDVVTGYRNQDFEMTNLIENLKKFPNNEVALEELSNILKQNQEGSLYINNNGYRYNCFFPLNINDWWLVTGVPENVLETRVSDITNIMKIVSGGIVSGALVMLIWFIYVQKKNETILKKIAYVDPFTKLYNKAYMQDNFLNNIKQVENKKSALVIYNIRKFKIINEIYGEYVGDKLIKQMAHILNANINSKYEIAIRDHSDEFSVLYFYKTREELEERIKTVIKQTEVMQVNNNDIQITLSVGIYEINDLDTSFERACSYAKMVKNKNKDGVDDFSYYSEELKKIELEEKNLRDDIQDGIIKKQFKSWLQPKYDAVTGKIIGAEALARWYKEDGRVLTPYHFIEFSEKSGLIQEIDRLVLEDVCKKISQWREEGMECIPISVNLSRAYLNNANSIYHVKKILDKYKIPSDYIQLEVTESAMVDSEEELGRTIETMHELGFKVLLDDFGVGYSSLISINNMQFDILKIDKSFVDTIGTNKGEHIVKYTITLAKSLGMKTIAEGVETKEQYDFLKEQECDIIQGYYFSKPLSGDDFKEKMLVLRTT